MGGKEGGQRGGTRTGGPGGVLGGSRLSSDPSPSSPAQYEDAFSPPRMQCWTVPRPPPKRPAPRVPTPFIADERGHLLPHVARSKESPWGTFLGTWEMPPRIPPARLDLSSRSPRAAARVIQGQPRALLRACNGLRTRVTGKVTPRDSGDTAPFPLSGDPQPPHPPSPSFPQFQKSWDTEPSGKGQGGLSGASPHPAAPNPGDNPEGGPCPQNPPGSGGPPSS
uniref:Protein Flattop n=1 Tax=Corvus moneduloides TaxID=1196302 RepID=A0A8U7NVZ4_CORMO